MSQETPEEPTPQTSRTIIIWIVLLIGLLAIAVAPIFLNRKKGGTEINHDTIQVAGVGFEPTTSRL